MGARTTDNSNISTEIIINIDAVNINSVGSYSVTYNISDAEGNSAIEVIRTVNVVDTTKPIIILNGDNPQVIELGTEYTELGARTTDNSDISTDIIIDATDVEVNSVGSYSVTYNISDAAGNPAIEVIRTVRVISPADTDNDGIFNNLDTCPNTPTSESANASGCSPSQIDTDNDGIFNNLDICPNTPTGESVNENGCSQSQIDTDNDGVFNDADTCPNTPANEDVNGNGCTPPTVMDMNVDSTGQTVTMQTSEPVIIPNNVDNEDFTVTSTLNGNIILHMVTSISTGSIVLSVTPPIPTGASVNITYEPTNGDNTDAITDNAGTPMLSINITLSNKDFELSRVSISPNPTAGILNITVVEKTNYRLLNIRGQILKAGVLATGKSKINLSPFARGVYLLNIKTSKGSFTKKVIRK